jgi:hypothetical protein
MATELKNFSSILGAFAVGMGAAMMLKIHSIKIAQKSKGWLYSIITILIIGTMVFSGLVYGKNSTLFLWLFNNVQIGVGGMFSGIRALFVISASYRAFRIKNLESTILLSSAVIILFMGAPLGIVVFPPISDIGKWILDVPNTAGFRGMIIGSFLGMMGVGIRLLIGKERTYQEVAA